MKKDCPLLKQRKIQEQKVQKEERLSSIIENSDSSSPDEDETIEHVNICFMAQEEDEVQYTELLDAFHELYNCLLYTSPSPRDRQKSRMPSSA